MKSKSFKDMTPSQQRGAMAVIAASLVIVGAAQRDLRRRPRDQIRGSRLLWRLVCLNAGGALVYFRWGRRPAADATD
jgi:hypothetical protein